MVTFNYCHMRLSVMYKIDKKNKRTEKIPEVSFEKLKIKEKEDIQEWIANDPSILEYDSELLIIQKEFDGFENTNRRLDLLALDSNGNLVIIENKRDDTGADVTWQAINYASFCSTLTKQDVISIYRDYLEKYNEEHCTEEEVNQKINDFLDNKVTVYPSDTQRIILVAHNFRKEVLSAAQWLNSNGLDITCIRFTPYQFNDALLLDVDRILPQEEIKDYTLKIAAKAADKKSQEIEYGKTIERNLKFWQFFSSKFNAKGTVFENINSWDTTKDSWKNASARFGKGLAYNLVITKNAARVELSISSSDKEYNKKVYDFYIAHKDEIKNRLHKYKPIWQRLDSKISSRIAIVNSNVNPSDEKSWDNVSAFFISTLADFVPVMSDEKYKKEISKIK